MIEQAKFTYSSLERDLEKKNNWRSRKKTRRSFKSLTVVNERCNSGRSTK